MTSSLSTSTTGSTGTWKDFVPLPSSLATTKSLSGWLQRQDAGFFGVWKKRFFRLEGDKLYWHQTDLELEHLGFINLHEVIAVTTREKSPLQLELRMKSRTMYLWCESEQDKQRWLTQLTGWTNYFRDQHKSILEVPPSVLETPRGALNLQQDGNDVAEPLSPREDGGMRGAKEDNTFIRIRSMKEASVGKEVKEEVKEEGKEDNKAKEVEELKNLLTQKTVQVDEWKKMYLEKVDQYKIIEIKIQEAHQSMEQLQLTLQQKEKEVEIQKEREEEELNQLVNVLHLLSQQARTNLTTTHLKSHLSELQNQQQHQDQHQHSSKFQEWLQQIQSLQDNPTL